MTKPNRWLILGGAMSAAAAVLHVAVIVGGPDWYRTFGAGETLATMAEEGSVFPALLTAGIAAVLTGWALYAFSGAGLIRRLPLLRPALLAIAAVYLLRGMAPLPIYVVRPEMMDVFWIWTSLVSLAYGLSHAFGIRQVWARLS